MDHEHNHKDVGKENDGKKDRHHKHNHENEHSNHKGVEHNRNNHEHHIKITLKLGNLDCQSCAVNIEKMVKKKVKDVHDISVNYYTGNAIVHLTSHDSLNEVIEVIENMGYEVVNKREVLNQHEHSMEHSNHEGHEHHDHGFGHVKKEVEHYSKMVKLAFLFFIPSAYLFLAKYFSLPTIENDFARFFLEFLLTTGMLYAGRRIMVSGYIGVKNLNPNMDSLVFIGVMAAYLYSTVLMFLNFYGYSLKEVYFDTATFILFFILLGKYLEAKAKNKTMDALNKLLALKPQKAIVVRDGKEVEINAKDIKEGDKVIIKPGDKVPVDGVILEGQAEFDESALTGESFPVFKRKEDRVLAGSICLNSRVVIKALTDGDKTIIEEMISTIKEVMEKKTALQNLADKISYYFVPSVIVIAILSFIMWFLVKDFAFALIAAISVLIIACPCGLGLAIPSVIVNSIALASKKGVLVKDIDALEKLHEVENFAFDKTGTLTKGELFVVKIIPQGNYSTDDVLFYASIAEQGSNHPIARAIIKHAKEKKIVIAKGENYEEIPGKGVTCMYEGKMLAVGNRIFVEEISGRKIEEEERVGKIMYIFYDKNMIGKIILDDEIKENAKEVLDYLRHHGKKTYLITGDHKDNALRIGKMLGFKEEEIKYSLLPKDKLKVIEELSSNGKVAYAGDGINDAMALAKSDIGIAMPVTEIAVSAGDLVLLNNKIDRIGYLYDLSKYHKRKVKQNLFWAFIYNVLAIPVAAGVLYPFTGLMLKPEIAAIAMSLSSVSVVSNALLMRVLFKSRFEKNVFKK